MSVQIESMDSTISQIICLTLGFYMLLINLATACVMAYDKYVSQSAKKVEERVPEQFMLQLIRLGGLFGAKCTMNILNHKTKKQSFLINSDSLSIKLVNFSLVSLFYIARYVH